MSDLLNELWVEKYRPKSLSEVVLEDDQRNFLNRCIEKGETPHLLLAGPPGSGKCHFGDELIDIYIEE